MLIGGVSTLRENLRQFLNSENILGTTAGVTIAIASGNFIQSFVKEIIFPSIYYLLKYKKGSDFSPIDAVHLTKFGKDFITFLIVVFITFIFIKYFLEFMFNLQNVNPKKT